MSTKIYKNGDISISNRVEYTEAYGGYIGDGLIMQFDSTSIQEGDTSWVDLVRGYITFSLCSASVDTGVLLDNEHLEDAARYVIGDDLITIEVCSELVDDNSGLLVGIGCIYQNIDIKFTIGIDGTRIQTYYEDSEIKSNLCYSTTSNNTKKTLSSVIMFDEEYGCKAIQYENGNLLQRLSHSGTPPFESFDMTDVWSPNYKTRVFSVRVYNRPLSQFEIAHNSSIDAQRFGINA